MSTQTDLYMIRTWLRQPYEDRAQTILEDPSFTDWFKPMLEVCEAAAELAASDVITDELDVLRRTVHENLL